MLIEAGGTLDALTKPAATSTLERYSPKELAGFLNALWDDQAHWPIPTDIRWEDFAPEKVMLRFKAELQRLQPYVEGWFSERGKSLPDWPKIYYVQQVRENDPTRVTGFVANILETPIAKEERLRAHRVSALKLYHAACLKDKAQREAQEAADAVRAASKAKREVERNRRHQEAKAKAARAGAFHPHSAKTEASSPAIQQLDSERLVERVRTLEGEIDHLSGRNAELESRIEAMKLETDSLKQLNSDLSEKRGNVLDEEAVKGILSRLCLDAQYEPTPEEALQCVAALHGDRVHVLPSAWDRPEKSTTTAMGGVFSRFS